MRHLAFAGAALLALAGAALAQEPRYPPYPEVWGRELVAPAGRIVNGFYVRDAGDGDFALAYSHRSVDPASGHLRGDGQWMRLAFFGGEARAISAADAEALTRGLPVPRLRIRGRGTGPLRFENGYKLMPTTREPKGVGCWVNYAGQIMVLDPDDQVIAQKMVLRLVDPPERREYWSGCERNRTEETYLAKVDALAMVLYPLADGTLLAEGTQSPFMIRFRPDLTSPFIESHPNLFVVDAAAVDRVVREGYLRGGTQIQAANDALHDYVRGLQQTKAR